MGKAYENEGFMVRQSNNIVVCKEFSVLRSCLSVQPVYLIFFNSVLRQVFVAFLLCVCYSLYQSFYIRLPLSEILFLLPMFSSLI